MKTLLLLAALLLVAAPSFAQSFAHIEFPSGPVNIAIPDSDPVGIVHTISIPNVGIATEVEVSVDITHTWVGDLLITLTHPTNGTITIMDRPGVPTTTFGCSEDDVDARFDDGGPDGPVETMCGPGAPGIFGMPAPDGSLATFIGNAQGDWTIAISDNAAGDTGQLNSWSLWLLDVVPVELTSFAATANGTDISLRWETASETNNAGFEVQLKDGDAWNALGWVEGHGTTTEAQTYTFGADELGVGTHIFRLKQIDFDGNFEYHGEVEATVETPGSHLISSAYPNPFNPQSQFTLAVAQEQNVTAELFNTLGQRVAVLFNGTVEANQAQLVTIDGAGLASGMYVVRVTGERFSDALSVTLLK